MKKIEYPKNVNRFVTVKSAQCDKCKTPFFLYPYYYTEKGKIYCRNCYNYYSHLGTLTQA